MENNRRNFILKGIYGLGGLSMMSPLTFAEYLNQKFIHPDNNEAYIAPGISELFVDDFMIANRKNTIRKIRSADKLEKPVLEAEMPWELGDMYEGKRDRRLYIYGTVLKDPETREFRMWYNRYNANYYATSSDGINWERPNLGLLGENNMINLHDFHSPSFIYDIKETDPGKRFKAVGSTQNGYKAAYSPDGLNWTLYKHNPILLSSDTITLSQDPLTGEYLAFHKRSRDSRVFGRQVFLSVSKDMQNWSEPLPVMVTDESDHNEARQLEGGTHSEFYNMSAFKYGNQWLGFVTHFKRTGKPKLMKGPFQSSAEGPIDVQLVHSRDGRIWNRLIDRSPIIPLGPYSYDSGSILGLCNLPVISNNEVWMYYTAMTTSHGGYLPDKEMSIARASWPLDRFVSLSADENLGIVETRSFVAGGAKLLVNYELKSGGQFKVEVLNETGNIISGYGKDSSKVIEDKGEFKQCGWEGTQSLPKNQVIRLRFHFRKGDLYSYRFE